MAARKPDIGNKKKQQMSKTSRVYKKKSRGRKQGWRQTEPYWRKFLRGDNERKKEQLYRLLQNQQPVLFQDLLQGESIAATELLDMTLHEISQIIDERDVTPEVDQVPRPEASDEIRQCNNLNIKRLSPDKYQELCQLCKTSVPILLLEGGQRRAQSRKLPDGVQIMVYRYLRKHLTPNEQIDPATFDPDEMPWRVTWTGGKISSSAT